MKHTYKHTKPRPSWLLQGLMIRAGLYDPLPPVAPSVQNLPRAATKGWFSRIWDKAKAAFVYDPDRT